MRADPEDIWGHLLLDDPREVAIARQLKFVGVWVTREVPKMAPCIGWITWKKDFIRIKRDDRVKELLLALGV